MELLTAFVEAFPGSAAARRDRNGPSSRSREALRLRLQDPGEHGSGHRDRIAFMRLCSGRYQPACALHVRWQDKETRISDALTFMAAERCRRQFAYAGDIIGLHNHDDQHRRHVHRRRDLTFTGVPNLRPNSSAAPC